MNVCKLMVGLFSIAFFVSANALSADEGDAISTKDKRELVGEFNRLLQDRDLRHEIEISEKQFVAATKIIGRYQVDRTKIDTEFVKAMFEAGDDPGPGVTEKLSQDYSIAEEELLAQVMLDLNDVLLPHQVLRLRQIARQESVARWFKDGVGLEMPLGLVEELDLSANERAKLVDAYKKLRPEFEPELEQLRDKYLKKIVAALPEDKRDLYSELVGDLFDFGREDRDRFLKIVVGRKSQE